jgi:hypothetical protein
MQYFQIVIKGYTKLHKRGTVLALYIHRREETSKTKKGRHEMVNLLYIIKENILKNALNIVRLILVGVVVFYSYRFMVTSLREIVNILQVIKAI